MKLDFKRSDNIDCSDYIALHTNSLVRPQMPFASYKFDEDDCREWRCGNCRRKIYPLQVVCAGKSKGV